MPVHKLGRFGSHHWERNLEEKIEQARNLVAESMRLRTRTTDLLQEVQKNVRRTKGARAATQPRQKKRA